MISIPAAMETLLKSKVMVGENRPSAQVEIDTAPSGDYNWATANDWKIPSESFMEHGPTVAKKANGKLIVCDVKNETVYEAECEDTDSLTGLDNSATGWASTGLSSLTHARAAVWNLDGGLYLTFSDAGSPSVAPARQEIYKSPSGNGGDWQLYATLQSLPYTATNTYGSHDLNLTGIPIKLESGRWVLVAGKWLNYYGYLVQNAYVWISDDNGVTWTSTYKLSAYMLAGDYYATVNKQIWVSPAGNLYTCFSESVSYCPFKVIKSTDNGITWSIVLNTKGYTTFGESSYYFSIIDNKKGGFYLFIGSAESGAHMVWDFPDPEADINNYRYVQHLPVHPSAEQNENTLLIEIDNTLIYARKYAVLGIALNPQFLAVKSVDVDMSKGMASQVTVVIDNKNGRYSPDRSASDPWHQVIWPNHRSTIKLGYGDNQQQVFTGLIDSVSMRTFPQELEFTARDMLKQALDQTVAQVVAGVTYYNITYVDQTAEYIARDLALKAGWADADIITEATGITIASIQFAHESYADCFQRLCELAGFEFYCDHEGKFYFVYATDRQPAVTDWLLTFAALNTPIVLRDPDLHPIVESSIILKYGETVYVNGTDYTFNGETNEIKALLTGSIPTGQTNQISYVYAAWVFREGEDIFALDYTITDQDIYSKVIVISQDSEGGFVRGDNDFGGVRYYDVLPGKVLIVNAGDLASTSEQCAAIAQRTGKASLTKPRTANFEAVGNPFIQVGDCIQVIESSTQISEIYRVVSLRHSWTPAGAKTTMSTYHYGYAPI